MSKVYIGIDPGSKGSLAAIDENDNVIRIYDLSKSFSDYVVHTRWIKDFTLDDVYVAVEDVCGRPGQSCVANTTFMKLAGMAELTGYMLVDYEDQFLKVKPQIWKKHFGLIGNKQITKTEKKHLSIELAKNLFPAVADSLTASKDGRAEALLIAKYCQEYFNSVQH